MPPPRRTEMFDRVLVPYIVLISLSGIAALVFTFLREVRGNIMSLVSKTVASAMFFITGVVLISILKSWVLGYAVAIVAGLFFALVGDVLLGLKRWNNKYSDVFLNAGMMSFAIAHVMYFLFLCFYTADVAEGSILVPAMVGLVALLVGVAMVLIAKKLDITLGGHVLKSIAYVTLLIYMTITSITNTALNGTEVNRLWMHTVAVSMFLIADLTLSVTYFGNKNNHALIRTCSVVNHIVYYAAQLMMCSIIVFVS